MFDSSIALLSSNVTSAVSELDGGGLSAWKASTLTLVNAVISNCSSTLLTGGAVVGAYRSASPLANLRNHLTRAPHWARHVCFQPR